MKIPSYRLAPRLSLSERIIDFIEYSNSYTITIDYWMNGGFNKLEINEPVINQDNGILTITDIDHDEPDIKVALSDIIYMNYSVDWFFIALKCGGFVKLMEEGYIYGQS